MWGKPALATIAYLGSIMLGGLAAGAFAVGLAAPASADHDVNGYVNALDAAGLIDHDGDPCNIIDGFCHGQFDDGPASVSTGVWVCQQVEQGRSRDSIVYELSHGEGLMPSSYNAPIIYDAATTHLC
jgi:Protein of unknown function (DUF732)